MDDEKEYLERLKTAKLRLTPLENVLDRFAALAAGFRTVGNDEAAHEVRELCEEIRRDGV